MIIRSALLFSILSFLLPSTALAEEESFLEASSALVSVQYVSKYMSRGFDLFPDDGPGVNPELFIDLGATGLYVGNWSMISLEHENRDFSETDFYFGYYNSLFADTPQEISYDLSYTYIYYPQLGREIDTQEFALLLEVPSLLAWGDFTVEPFYTFIWEWPTKSGTASGFWHRFGASLNYPFPTLNARSGEWESSPASLFAESYLSDGAAVFETNHGFNHVTYGLNHTIATWGGVKLIPSIYYQRSLDSTVNTENEVWFQIKLSLDIPAEEDEAGESEAATE